MSSLTSMSAATSGQTALGDLPEEEKQIEGRSTWQLAWARLKRDRAAMISLGVILFIIIVAIAAPVVATITGHGADEQFRTTGLTPDGIPVGALKNGMKNGHTKA